MADALVDVVDGRRAAVNAALAAIEHAGGGAAGVAGAGDSNYMTPMAIWHSIGRSSESGSGGDAADDDGDEHEAAAGDD